MWYFRSIMQHMVPGISLLMKKDENRVCDSTPESYWAVVLRFTVCIFV